MADPAVWNFAVLLVEAKLAPQEVAAYAAAQQRQVREHFAPAWQLPATTTVRVITDRAQAAPGEVVVYLHDDVTPGSPAGALAYHTQEPDGTPACHVFCGLAEKCFEVWTKASSHEVLETLGDPRVRRCVEVLTDGSIWDVEVCDRVEQDQYPIDGVLLSNFCTPECFEPPDSPPPGTKYDYMGLCTSPNQVRPGGYAQKYVPGTGWSQVGQMSEYRGTLADAGIGRIVRREARNPAPRPWWRRLLGLK